MVDVNLSVTNVSDSEQSMVMAIIGIPPGFAALPSYLQEAVEEDLIELFEVRGNELVLYLGHMDAGSTCDVTLKMRSSLAVHAEAPAGRAYLYYNPEVRVESLPVLFTVTE